MFNWLHSTFIIRGSRHIQKSDTCRLDKTGLIVEKVEPVPILRDDGEVLFPNYEMLPYALAKAQEFSLFRMYKSYLARPLTDFGCGDGSFAAVFLDTIDFAIDNDPEALQVAKGYRTYLQMVESSDKNIPLENGSIQSVMSNSVVEHVISLDSWLDEIHRILKGAYLAFTVPLLNFKDDLARYFGARASIRLNREAYHRNPFSPQDWRGLLERHDSEVVPEKQYQPAWFTFWREMPRLTGRTGFGLLAPGVSLKIRYRYKQRSFEALRKSVKARKRAAMLCLSPGNHSHGI
jgi:ubiquinone/menaquinone biosynthesis C-methylase UbiE